MPLAAIRELSSLSARSGRIATNESSERKGCLRPARITRRSQTASLRLSEAQRQRRGTEGAVRNGFSKHPVGKAPKKCGDERSRSAPCFAGELLAEILSKSGFIGEIALKAALPARSRAVSTMVSTSDAIS